MIPVVKGMPDAHENKYKFDRINMNEANNG